MENEAEQAGDPRVAEHLLDVCYHAYGVAMEEAAAARREMRLILDGGGDDYREFWPNPLRDALERYIAARRAEELLHGYRDRYVRGAKYQTTAAEDLDFGPVGGEDPDAGPVEGGDADGGAA